MRVVLNAIIAKSDGGGASQIVFNYLNASLADTCIEWYYIISEEFVELLNDSSCINSGHWLVLPRQPQVRTFLRARKAITSFLDTVKPDIVYSILAPSYFTFRYIEVMRCCNAWDVIKKDDEAFSFIDSKTRLKFGLKTMLVRHLMKQADYFITQTQVAKEGIVRVTGIKADNVAVIPNVLPRYYQSVIPERKKTDIIDILYVASPSPHKNIGIIPEVARILKYEYKLNNFRFLTTIPSRTDGISSQLINAARSLSVEANVINVGGKSQKELVDLYESATIGFFPSVLETFSATLLEYMYFGLPIVSSDKPFNTEVLGDAALLFDVTDARSAADAIFSIINNPDLRDSLITKAEQRIKKYLNYDEHYRSTIEFFEKIVRNQ